ncbi:MAG: DUF559 domain-containing protein [Pseudomonadota bacterium]
MLPSPCGRGIGGEGISRGTGMTRKARVLRGNMTEAEKRLWQEIRRDRLGVRFRRQMPVLQRYILDFYAPSIRLAVELDGGHHADNSNDIRRTVHLNAHGISVLRFWNIEVMNETETVVETLFRLCSAMKDGIALTAFADLKFSLAKRP